MRLKYKKELVPDFSSLVMSYSSKELASPKRSTVPLLAYWAHPEARLRDLCRDMGVNPAAPLDFRFEFPACAQRSVGRDSFTDLMVLSPKFAIAIEAIYTEPANETVTDWLGNPRRSNRVAVLDGWIEQIERGTGVRLSSLKLHSHPYQLIHRTASACFPPVDQRWVIYQLFSKTNLPYYQEHLDAMHRLLRNQTRLSFGLLISPPEASEEYKRLKNLWASGQRNLADSIRYGLLSESLFKFNRIEFISVNALNSSTA